MARKDVILYYLQVQNQYFEMVANVKDVEEAIKSGILEQSRADEMTKEIETIKNNYERLSYIMFLMNKPNKTQKQFNEERQNKEWYEYLSGSSKEAIINENNDALADFKKFVRELKEIKKQKEVKDENN